MRVGILSLLHESNTFLSTPTTLELFQKDRLLIGPAIRERLGKANHEISGFMQGLDAQGIEVLPIFAALATPSGRITRDCCVSLVTMMLEQLDAALKVGIDGLLVAPHGAGVSENEPDLDGYWLTQVRQRVGPGMPVICTLDLHANVSARMIAACDASIGYRTNPHLDHLQTGLKAADLMARTLRGEIKPVQRAAFPRIAINIERQLTATSPCKDLYAFADAQLAGKHRGKLVSNSVLLGFPYADVAEMGTSTIAVTDNDPQRAQQLADELANWILERRSDFVGHFISPAEAVTMAATGEWPVTLLDMGDNVGGGSSADGTILAHELLRQKVGPAVVAIYDPKVQQQARDAGVGAKLELSIGGKTDTLHGEPLVGRFEVLSVNDGRWHETQPRHGGMVDFNQGATTVVRTCTDPKAGLTVILNSRRTMPASIGQITSCGLDPAQFRVLVAKGVHAPVAAYQPVSKRLIRVNTPGVTCADMRQLNYLHRRKPLFPFEDVG